MAIPQEEQDTFGPWLKKKKLSYASFSRETGVNHYTVAELGSGDNWRPRDRIADLIRKRYRDCPLLKRKPRETMRGISFGGNFF